MAETDKPAGAKTIIDVAHPGKSAPSDNSKSVIVNSRPLLKDPMVVTDNAAEMPAKEPVKPIPPAEPEPEPAEPEAKSDPELKPSPEKVVEPPADASSSDEPEVAPEPQPKAETEPEPKPEPKPEVAEDDEKKDQPPAKGSPEQLEAEAAAAAKHQADVEKLADSKQYYLPINTAEKRKAKRFVVLGILLSVILVLAWADIALDAGLVHVNSVKPVTHFFSN
jgi:serine/threonine-protein kinase